MIKIYGRENCPWCDRAKDLAINYQLKFEYFDIKHPAIRERLFQELPDAKTVPQIWWGNRHIGGYEDFASEIQNTIGGFGEQKI